MTSSSSKTAPASTVAPPDDAFRVLVHSVRDYAIFMLDPTGRVLTWNLGAQQLKGYAPEEIIGSHFSRFYPPEALARKLPEHELVVAAAVGRFEDEGWRVRKDGGMFWANVIITALRDEQGRLLGYAKVTRDLSERRKHEEALRLSEERFRLLVEGVSDYAIIMLDRSGLVTSWNSGAQAITGYSTAEMVGRHFAHLFSSEDVEANKPSKSLALAQHEGRAMEEGWRKRKDGALFWSNTVLTALSGGDSHSLGFACVLQDLTHRRHAESLADAAQRMQEFIAMLAHELRNPLAPIRSAVEVMARKGLPDPTLESMRKVIDRQSTYLMRLLDDLLDVSRIARGEFTVRKEDVELRDVLNRALETSRPLIESRRHRLLVDDIPTARLHGDLIRLTQVFVNLLNNAAKYTPEGGEIRITASVRGDDAEIRIIDNGEGVAPDKLEAIFDLFTQLNPTGQTSAVHGGLGVGLALVRRVAEMHGGRVFARSAGVGRGSQFVVHLPISTQAQDAAMRA